MTGHLGIDLGTSAVKVLVRDEDGAALASASRHYPTNAPRPGWAEQSPEAWWEATCAATREAVAAAGTGIASVGLSGQLNGFVLLDDRLEPLADAVIWLDIRATDEARRLAALRDFPALTGNVVSPICVLPKLAWFRAHKADLLARARRITLAKDYLLLRLTGEFATDPCDALSTAMTERGGRDWSQDLCALADVDPSMLPPIRPGAALAGRVTREAAASTGLTAGTPVATGAGDVAALAVGCGIMAEGQTAITLGTAGHVVTEALAGGGPSDAGLWRIPHGVFGRDLWLGLIMSGGLSLSWLRTVLAHEKPPSFADLEALAAAVPPGADGVTFAPFLEGAATPYNRPDVRGAFHGLSSAHGTGHLVRAVMEGVAFNVRQCIETLAAVGAPSSEVRLAEGGAQSDSWCQIIADALGRPVHRIAERDTSAAGAAILGEAALSGRSVEEIARHSVRFERSFTPGHDTRAVLDEAYRAYQSTVRAVLGDSNGAGAV